MTPAQSATIAEPAAPETGGQGVAPPENCRTESAAPAPRPRRGPTGVLGVRLLRRRPAGPRRSGAPRWARIRPKGSWLLTAAELVVLALWTLLFARPYLDLNPDVVPLGREYLSNIQTHFLWSRVASCGWCAVWNGSFRGGYPALADPHGSMLHPLVMVATLGWGVAGGAKLAMAGAFFMGGLAQWWLGRVVGFGRLARVWSACLAVVAGHLAGKMEAGNFGLLLSTAATALVLPPLLTLGLDGGRSRRGAVVLGVTLALAAVAGQAYMQIGLVLLLPVVFLAAPYSVWKGVRGGGPVADRTGLPRFLGSLALAGGIGLLLAAPFIVPTLHFLPQFGKDTDPIFRSAQPFPFVPLNLVINDHDFYRGQTLGRLPFPYLYATFVGWIPVLLAFTGLATLWTGGSGSALERNRRVALFLAGVTLLALWIASAAPLLWLAQHIPFPRVAAQMTGLRYPPVIAGLAVPAVLALAGAGLDRILSIIFAPGGPAPWWAVGLRRALVLPLAVLLIVSLIDARAFSRQWMGTSRRNAGEYALLAALRTPDLQWVNTPYGEQFWIEPALRQGLKLNLGTQGWYWAGRTPPAPVAEGFRGGVPPGTSLRGEFGGIPVYDAQPGREYAAVEGAGTGERAVCSARGTGGDIDVVCDAPFAGTLTLKENAWSGWRVRVDGATAALRPGTWLAVDLPAGAHTVSFRYRPWDVPLGLLLAGGGVALAGYAWWRDGRVRG